MTANYQQMQIEQRENNSDIEYHSEIENPATNFGPPPHNQTKKQSAFKSNSSHSSKHRHVGFTGQADPVEINSVQGSRHAKKYSSWRGGRNTANKFLEQSCNNKNSEADDSRILIHITSQGQVTFDRIKSSILFVRQLQNYIVDLIHKQKSIFSQMMTKFSKQFANKLSASQRQSSIIQTTDNEETKGRIKELEKALKNRDYEYKQLVQEIQELRTEKNRLSKNKAEDISSYKRQPCTNCKLLEIRTNSLRQDALQSSKKIKALEAENESLQEVIFDLQQQVVGVNLQVQKRLKSALSSVPQIGPPQPMNQHQLIDQLMQDNQKLQDKCKRYEELCRSEEQLQQKQEKLNHIAKEYQLKNEALLQALARSQATNQRNYQKQHQLLLAEQEYYKKLEELRKKQIQLSKWQAKIAEKRTSSKYLQLPSEIYSQNQADVQISMRNIANQPPIGSEQQQQYYSDYRVVLPTPNYNVQKGIDRKNQSQGATKNYMPGSGYESKNYHNRRGTDIQRQSRMQLRNPPENTHPTSMNKQYGSKGMRPSASNHSFFERASQADRASLANNRYAPRRNSPMYGDKHSSPARSFKSNNLPYMSRSNVQHNQNFIGLQSKLDKLREELKKQLESIK